MKTVITIYHAGSGGHDDGLSLEQPSGHQLRPRQVGYPSRGGGEDICHQLRHGRQENHATNYAKGVKNQRESIVKPATASKQSEYSSLGCVHNNHNPVDR
jgi:hypothetical protein